MLTKTDFLRYLEAPMHLWAYKHGWLDQVVPSRYDRHLMAQGVEIEGLAQEFLRQYVAEHFPDAELSFQTVLTDDTCYARLDAAVTHPETGLTDIYEIKSASSVKKEHLYDAAFQRLVAEANLNLGHVYLLHINKQYQRQGEVDLDALFVIENVDAETEDLRQELLAGRAAALAAAEAASPDEVEACLKPKDCPCPRLCHPGLPEHSIYNLPRMHAGKLKELREAGLVAIDQLPPDFPLSANQRRHADVMRSRRPYIDLAAIRSALDGLVYPLYFLDYETVNPAVPWYDGYAPYQNIVFQYSLHVLESPESEPVHYEYLAVTDEDPGPGLLADLTARIGDTGSVIVWNQSFEASRNREMAARYPEYADRLLDINRRIYDLMEVFSKGSYVHPDFRGSASIKNVLPVLVKDLSYDGLPIPAGDEAMIAWIEMMRGELTPEEFEQTRQNLLRYCELDTLAMVRNWQFLVDLAAGTTG